jgi:phosphoribosylamine--glycine ligase
MNILFISHELIGGNIARLLREEGHNVKLSIEAPNQKNNLRNFVSKIDDWRNELKWVGKDGLIIFDDTGYGKIQDRLRQKGYSVFGGSEIGDKLEHDREFCNKLFHKYNIQTLPLKNFKSIKSAMRFLRKEPGPWVIKQNGHLSKVFNYVGHFEDNRDTLEVLKNYNEYKKHEIGMITLQKKVSGVEIGVARYFNGNDWVGPIEMNIEHKRMFPGDIGPSTAEMGTLAWYDDNKKNKLFQETLAKLKPYLQKIDFRGDFDINCIVNEDGAWPLEATPRLGTPIIHLHTKFHLSPWGEFLKAVADGKSYDLKWQRGFGIVVTLATPPFPYQNKFKQESLIGVEIYFDENDTDLVSNLHFEGVSIKREGKKNHYYISDAMGYILYVTGLGKTVGQASTKAYQSIGKINIPKVFYRNDIGQSFIATNKAKLRKLGYLK